MRNTKRNWWIAGFMGALFVGSGLTMVVDGGLRKYDGQDFLHWAGLSTLGFALIMIGLRYLSIATRIDTILGLQKQQYKANSIE